jgi:hypothetical protein
LTLVLIVIIITAQEGTVLLLKGGDGKRDDGGQCGGESLSQGLQGGGMAGADTVAKDLPHTLI